MKSPRFEFTRSLTLIAVAAALPALLYAQGARGVDQPADTSSQGASSGRTSPESGASSAAGEGGVYLASIDVGERSLARYAGERLLNHQGAELGTIKDFIVHP